MDPNVNLAEQRSIARCLLDMHDSGNVLDAGEIEENAIMLADLVIALDEWITKGGFLPTTWRKHE